MFDFPSRKSNILAMALAMLLVAVVFGFMAGALYARIDMSQLVELPKGI